MQTLSFKEFLIAMGCFDLYEELDIYGGSEERTHYELRELYRIYTAIGGYPAVVLQYMESHSLPECEAVLLKIIKLFIQEIMSSFIQSYRHHKRRLLKDHVFHKCNLMFPDQDSRYSLVWEPRETFSFTYKRKSFLFFSESSSKRRLPFPASNSTQACLSLTLVPANSTTSASYRLAAR